MDTGNVALLILTGGYNTRYHGQKKLFLLREGQPFITHLLDAFRELERAYLSVDSCEGYEELGLPMAKDLYPGCGPLGGLVSAFEQCPEEALFVTACDMPFVTAEAVRAVLEQYAAHPGVTLAAHGEELEPLFGIYPRSVLPEAKAMLKEGRRKIRELLVRCGGSTVQIENEGDIFRNINTPEEYARFVTEQENASPGKRASRMGNASQPEHITGLPSGRKLRVKAHAKVNLALDILGKRPDGYHELAMVMQELALCDEILLSVRGDGKISLAIEDRRGKAAALPADEHNLMWKAAKLLLEKYGSGIREQGRTGPVDEKASAFKDRLAGAPGVDMRLVKNIPSEAGLGGGSADAAAVLKGLNRLFELGLGTEELCELGVRIGADVPFCILGGTALAEGIGEKLTPLQSGRQDRLWHVLLAKPSEGLSTPAMYRAADAVPAGQLFHPDVKGMWARLKDRDPDNAFLPLIGNSFETVAEREIPLIGELKERMLAAGALAACMSGSGPTVFGIFRTREGMLPAAKALEPMLAAGELSDLRGTCFCL